MRQWRGRVPAEKAADYFKFLETSGFKDYAETPGNLAVYAFEWMQGAVTEIVLVTLWESVEAIIILRTRIFCSNASLYVAHYEVPFALLKESALK